MAGQTSDQNPQNPQNQPQQTPTQSPSQPQTPQQSQGAQKSLYPTIDSLLQTIFSDNSARMDKDIFGVYLDNDGKPQIDKKDSIMSYAVDRLLQSLNKDIIKDAIDKKLEELGKSGLQIDYVKLTEVWRDYLSKEREQIKKKIEDRIKKEFEEDPKVGYNILVGRLNSIPSIIRFKNIIVKLADIVKDKLGNKDDKGNIIGYSKPLGRALLLAVYDLISFIESERIKERGDIKSEDFVMPFTEILRGYGFEIDKSKERELVSILKELRYFMSHGGNEIVREIINRNRHLYTGIFKDIAENFVKQDIFTDDKGQKISLAKKLGLSEEDSRYLSTALSELLERQLESGILEGLAYKHYIRPSGKTVIPDRVLDYISY